MLVVMFSIFHMFLVSLLSILLFIWMFGLENGTRSMHMLILVR